MAKKIIPVVSIVLLLFAGIIALTQELDAVLPLFDGDDAHYFPFDFGENGIPEMGKPVRWFRSNAGGMALEEIQSRLVALSNEYALAIDSARRDEMPERLLPYYDENYFIEIRTLFKKGGQVRTQWLFRDAEGATRVNAVFLEPEKLDAAMQAEAAEEKIPDGEESADIVSGADNGGKINSNDLNEKQTAGFIEIFDENLFLTSEYRFFEDGEINRTDYKFNGNMLISSVVLLWEDNDKGGEYKPSYTDLYRYNRSLFLRAVERVFYKDSEISVSDDPVRVAFPRNLADAAKSGIFINERFNSYPEFFGDVFVHSNSKIVFETDERGRILRQTLYDEEGNIIWVIRNAWRNDRIVSSSKKEGDTELLAEYAYNSGGERILERNLRNGVLERLVRTEGEKDIEELYINNVIVLRAVWEDGRKISETRMR